MEIAKFLALHSAITLLISLLCGIPYGKAINRQASAQKIHGWRVAHASLALGAATGFAIAAVMASLLTDNRFQTTNTYIAWLVVICNYAFSCALTVGAATEHRGLHNTKDLTGKFVYFGNMLGVLTSIAFTLLLIFSLSAS